MPTSEKYFDQAYYSSGGYDEYESDVRSWTGRVAKKIVRSLAGVPAPRVLDAGCAHGFLLEELLQLGCKVKGLEYSPYAIQTASPMVQKYIRQGSILKKNLFPAHTFDAVICFDVVEYLTRDETEKAIGNLARWTKNLIFFAALYRHSRQSSQKHNPDPARRTTLSQKEYQNLFQKYGAFLLEKKNLGNGGDILIFQAQKIQK